jgi:hypothetical protein
MCNPICGYLKVLYKKVFEQYMKGKNILKIKYERYFKWTCS